MVSLKVESKSLNCLWKNILKNTCDGFSFLANFKKNVLFHIYLLRISNGAISYCFLES